MGGIVGRFMSSFGLTSAAAIAVSLLVSFTLTPMLAARWIKVKEMSLCPLAKRRFQRANSTRSGRCSAAKNRRAEGARAFIEGIALVSPG
jgi:multidrug efflux pump subunit AcrB